MLFPAGTPADEEVLVVARGEAFGNDEAPRAKVAPDGRFRLAFPEWTKEGRLALEARYLYLDPEVRWARAETPEEIVLEPRLGGRITGRLVAPAGIDPRSVVGKVKLARTVRQGSLVHEMGHVEHALDATLTFEFGGLAVGSSYRAVYEGETLTGSSPEIEVQPGETSTVKVPLETGIVLAGRVVDETGAGIAEAQLLVLVERFPVQDHRPAASASDGTFRIAGLTGGKVTLQAYQDGRVAAEVKLGALATGDVREGLVLELVRGSSVAGRVQWPDGKPTLAEVEVLPEDEDLGAMERMEAAVTADCGEDGTFEVNGLGRGPFRVRARARPAAEAAERSELSGNETTGWWRASVEHVDAGQRDLVLVLAPGLALEGRVVDDLGAPVTSFHVIGTRITRHPDGWMGSKEALATEVAGQDGTFRLEGFVPGEWELRVNAAGYGGTDAIRFTIPAERPLEITLTRGASVSGRVLDPSGVAVHGAQILAEVTDGNLGSAFWNGNRSTDENGAFEVTGLRPVSTRIRATASGWAPSESVEVALEPGRAENGLVLQLRDGGRITGEVRDAQARPVVDARVSLSSWRSGYHETLSSGPEGAFEVQGVPPGTIQVTAQLGEGFEIDERLEIAAGESVHVVLAPTDETVRMHGRVRVGGEPAAGAIVYVQRRSGGPRAECDESGEYEVTLPAPDTYSVSVYQSDVSVFRSVEVPRAEEFRFDVVVEVGHISGCVRDGSGRALAGLRVTAGSTSRDAGDGARGRTGEDGRYEFRVPVGTYTVMAGGNNPNIRGSAPSYARTSVDDVVVGPDASVRDIDLVLRRGGVLRGVVRSMADDAWAMIWIAPASGRGDCRHLGGARADGAFQVNGVEAGAWLVSAASPHRRSAWVRVDMEAGAEREVELELAPATWMAVSVRAAGLDPRSATVEVLDASDLRHAGRLDDSGDDSADGPRHIAGPFPPGTYRVRAELGGRTAERTVTIESGCKRLEVELTLE